VEKLKSIENRTEILLCDAVMMEVLRGARSDLKARQIEQDLRRFDIATILGPDRAARAANNYRRLRSLGITVRNSIDLMIATYCIEHGHHLLHRDRDFDHFERQLGLRVLHA
jgi:predicted nucleic acid-binding protein